MPPSRRWDATPNVIMIIGAMQLGMVAYGFQQPALSKTIFCGCSMGEDGEDRGGEGRAGQGRGDRGRRATGVGSCAARGGMCTGTGGEGRGVGGTRGQDFTERGRGRGQGTGTGATMYR